MKVKDLKQIINTYNSELKFRFIVMQDDIGEGGEHIKISLCSEDYLTYRFNKKTKELEIIIDL